MARKINFNPGPAALPLTVLEQIREQIADYQGKGYSLIEASHRGKEYEEIHNAASELIRETLKVPVDYKILFLGGGATLQFGMVALNFLSAGKSCDFFLTGEWSKKALADAEKIGRVNVVFDGSIDNYTSLPAVSAVKYNPHSAYAHMTSNETIHGVQWQEWPDTGHLPLIVDMSSDIMSRPVPMEKIALAYAGAQKNLGAAGVTVVIIRDDLLERCPDTLPSYLSYKVHAENNSLYNTPPVFAVWVMRLVMEWIKAAGGLGAMQAQSIKKAEAVYSAIDESGGFYRAPVKTHCRSKMNVVFRLPNDELEKRFFEQAQANGMVGLKGHRSVGGCRASLYNALPLEGAQALAAFMKDFAQKNG